VLDEPVNFIYDRVYKKVSKLYIINTETTFEEELDPSEVVVEVENIKRELEQEERLKQQLTNILLNQDIILEKENISIDKDIFDIANFKNAIFKHNNTDIIFEGSIKISEKIFLKIQSKSHEFQDIEISEFNRSFFEYEVISVTNEQGFKNQDIKLDYKFDQSEIFISNFFYNDIALQCNFDIKSYKCKNVMIDGIPLEGAQNYQNFETIRKILQEKIDQELQEEENLLEELNKNLEEIDNELFNEISEE
jgi:hypothetical protein